MAPNSPGPDTPTDHKAPAPVSASAWLRASVTLTVERWMLVAAGLAGFVLLLLALD